jgi:hypothetical protein
MRSPVERWRQRQARRRYMPRVERSKTGITTKLALAVLVLIILIGALLEMRRGGAGAEGAFVEHARENALDPLALVEAAGQSRQLIFLADVTSAPAPKRFAARAVERLATRSGLDLVVLDVPASEQPFIDQYLATTPEDASLLLARPRAIREGDGASREFVDLYRAIWRVNAGLGAHRRVRIVAADHPSWPPHRAMSPHAAARLFGERDPHMLDAAGARALNRNPNARILFFVDGLHALKSGGGRVQTGGTTPVEVTWLAALLAERYAGQVFSILVDAVPSRVITTDAAAYSGTRLGEPLKRAGVRTGFALRSAPALDAVARSPIRVVGTTGIEFMLEPRAAPFSRLADAYIYLGS